VGCDKRKARYHDDLGLRLVDWLSCIEPARWPMAAFEKPPDDLASSEQDRFPQGESRLAI
jgi:hypothetical protein